MEVEDRTWVPEFKPVRSSVVPEGTATLLRTIVAQEVLDLLASEAPVEPENVHEALLAKSGAAVGSGAAVAAGAGAANTREAAAMRSIKAEM